MYDYFSRSVNYFEIVNIDVLEARDYVARVLDVNLFLLAKRTSIFERFMETNKIQHALTRTTRTNTH